MTRWARSGNTQKHQKVPGDATKWGEFDHQKVKHSYEKKIKEENASSIKNPDQFSEKKNVNVPFKAKTSMKRQKMKNRVVDKSNCYEAQSNTIVSANETRDSKINISPDNISGLPDTCLENSFDEETGVSPKRHKKNKNSKSPQANDNQTKTSSKVFENKKEIYLKKLQNKRAKNGIILLPSKVERKLYIIKKKLRDKGLPTHILKEIIRKERRKEELKFRKTFNPSKLCFNCRQPGHLFADCPQKLESSNQETGVCFKCGSDEHTSFKCPKKVQGFPFAKCFICKEQGHISKDCPKNKHGIYPKGGRCNLCGNVNHLKKDCPTLIKKETDESAITLHTINEATSMDAEIIEKKDVKKESIKKQKIVKF